MKTNNETPECPVCGGTMRPVASARPSTSQRFRCTCGHFQDFEAAWSPYRKSAASALPEGFQEFEVAAADPATG